MPSDPRMGWKRSHSPGCSGLFPFQRLRYSRVLDGTRYNLKSSAAALGSGLSLNPGLASLNPSSSFLLCLSWLSLGSQHSPALAWV